MPYVVNDKDFGELITEVKILNAFGEQSEQYLKSVQNWTIYIFVLTCIITILLFVEAVKPAWLCKNIKAKQDDQEPLV